MSIADELREQANQHPLDADLEMFNVAATRIESLESALAYAIKEADGWHDDCRGGDIETEEMVNAKKVLGA